MYLEMYRYISSLCKAPNILVYPVFLVEKAAKNNTYYIFAFSNLVRGNTQCEVVAH